MMSSSLSSPVPLFLCQRGDEFIYERVACAIGALEERRQEHYIGNSGFVGTRLRSRSRHPTVLLPATDETSVASVFQRNWQELRIYERDATSDYDHVIFKLRKARAGLEICDCLFHISVCFTRWVLNDDGLFIHVILELFAAKSLQDLVLYMLSRLSMRTVDSLCLTMPPVYWLYKRKITCLLSLD